MSPALRAARRAGRVHFATGGATGAGRFAVRAATGVATKPARKQTIERAEAAANLLKQAGLRAAIANRRRRHGRAAGGRGLCARAAAPMRKHAKPGRLNDGVRGARAGGQLVGPVGRLRHGQQRNHPHDSECNPLRFHVSPCELVPDSHAAHASRWQRKTTAHTGRSVATVKSHRSATTVAARTFARSLTSRITGKNAASCANCRMCAAAGN